VFVTAGKTGLQSCILTRYCFVSVVLATSRARKATSRARSSVTGSWQSRTVSSTESPQGLRSKLRLASTCS